MAPRNQGLGIFLGILLLIGLHLAAIFVAYFLSFAVGSTILFAVVFGIGLAQLFYVLPAIAILARRGYPGMVKGLIIGAVITALLNGGCFLFIFAPR